MITATGADYQLSGFGLPDDTTCPLSIADIAHHLAQINRFTGACSRPYSVAEHSLLCSEIAERAGRSLYVQRAALMHDAHEAFTQDLSSPAKHAVNTLAALSGGTRAWTQFEDAHAKHLRRHFNLTSTFVGNRQVLKQIDLQALATERRDLTRWRADVHLPWDILGDGGPANERIEPAEWLRLDTPERAAMTWADWRSAFLDRYNALRQAIKTARQAA